MNLTKRSNYFLILYMVISNKIVSVSLFILTLSILIIIVISRNNNDNDSSYSINRNIKLAKSCLNLGNIHDFHYPVDAEEHYSKLLLLTKPFRTNLTIHNYKGYNGPWIENYFIENFINKPLRYFNGFIPLFVQWSDYKNIHKKYSTDVSMFNYIKHNLRPNVIYLTVSQANHGLAIFKESQPNVLVLSAGGVGNIAIPLLKKELQYSQYNSSLIKYNIGFYGTYRKGPIRTDLFKNVKSILKKFDDFNININKSVNWISDMSSTLFNLAPRGIGRTSFRLSEIIQIGRIPIYIYDDYAWLPYYGTPYSIDKLGFVCKVSEIGDIINKLYNMDEKTIEIYIKRVSEARQYYTYKGVINQIELFLQNPFKQGLLKCSKKQPPFSNLLSSLDINL